ncbi:MAG: cyd operon protein YbgT [Hyphomonas sp. 34-62-18]|nr:cytochrome bd-I oxidase subunit CydX [Hyphomonas sp. 34-62-18]OZB18896.1 MAG: cyd operon protein YbgT [Hyphomonas sp. 34-62-18]
MWYFTWILGLGFALTFGILNALWNEFSMSDAGENDLEIDG